MMVAMLFDSPDVAALTATAVKLHSQFCERLAAVAADATLSATEALAAVQQAAVTTMRYDKGESPPLRDFHLRVCAIDSKATDDARMLSALAAVSHCSGDCSQHGAREAAVALLPCLHTRISALQRYLKPLAADLAAGVPQSLRGSGGCQCHKWLCTAISGIAHWRPELVARGSMARSGSSSTCAVAVQPQLQRGARSAVVACCKANDPFPAACGECKVAIKVAFINGHYGVYVRVSDATDAAKDTRHWHLGVMRCSQGALAAFSLTAAAWVWQLSGDYAAQNSCAHSLNVPGLMKALSFSGSLGPYNLGKGYEKMISAQRAADYGYKGDGADALLVFALSEML